MNDPLAPLKQTTLHQAAIKLEWAAIQFRQLIQFVEDYLNGHVGFKVDEKKGLHEFVIFSQPLPAEIQLHAETCVHATRSALDTGISSLIAAAGGRKSRTNFPMHETEAQLRADFAKGKTICPNCNHLRETKPRQKEIIETLPELVPVLFETLKPWRGGNDALWALSKLDNIQKHRSIMPVLSFSEFNVDFVTDEHMMFIGNTVQIWPNQMKVIGRSKKPIIPSEGASIRVAALIPNEMPAGGKPLVLALQEFQIAATNALMVIATALKDHPAMRAG